MPSDTDSAANPPPTPVPSVFISYASEDRPAARALRDVLTAAGLDVWYDESELGGGDAWDQKIRRQIRDCDYFMPLISANTEARLEGYFRREWRLATERTLDMADGLLFLLPVAIDDTGQFGACVPEKFLTVQWLRAPGGQPTPAFTALLERLRAGDHNPLPRQASGPTRAPFSHARTAPPFGPAAGTTGPLPPPVYEGGTGGNAAAPPPMPPFPHVPEKGGILHAIKFLAEVLWWALTAAWLLFGRLPRWARILVTIWLVITLFSIRCSRPVEISSPPAPPRPASSRGGDIPKKLRPIAERLSQSARDGSLAFETGELTRLATEIAQVFADNPTEASPAHFGRTLVVIPFAPPTAESSGGKFAHATFLSLYGRISIDRRGDVGVVPPLRTEPLPAVLLARGRAVNAAFVLAARPVADAADAALEVQLFSVADAKVTWTESFPLQGADATTVAEKIAAAVLERVPRKELRRPKEAK